MHLLWKWHKYRYKLQVHPTKAAQQNTGFHLNNAKFKTVSLWYTHARTDSLTHTYLLHWGRYLTLKIPHYLATPEKISPRPSSPLSKPSQWPEHKSRFGPESQTRKTGECDKAWLIPLGRNFLTLNLSTLHSAINKIPNADRPAGLQLPITTRNSLKRLRHLHRDAHPETENRHTPRLKMPGNTLRPRDFSTVWHPNSLLLPHTCI